MSNCSYLYHLRYAVITALLFFCFSSEAQYTIVYNDDDGLSLINNDVLICQEISDSVHLVRVIIDDDAANDSDIRIEFPPGVEYVEGSLILITEVGGLSISEISGTPNYAKEFEISPVNLNEGDEITFGYSRKASCPALAHQLAGGAFKDDITVSGDAGSVSESNINLANYDLLVPALSIFNEGPISTTVGSTVTREIRIVNGGLGFLNDVSLYIDDETNTNTTSLTTLSGTTLTPTSSGSVHTYLLDQAIIAQFGDGDQLLENGEEIVLIRTYEVQACECSSSYQASWGCGGEICAETEVLPQQTNILNSVPDLDVRIPINNEDLCWDGSNSQPGGTPTIQTVSVQNVGTGSAINFKLTMYNYNPGSGRGRNYFDLVPWVVKNTSGAVIGTMTNPVPEEYGTYYGSDCSSQYVPATVVQEATGIVIEPGETILIEVPVYISNLDCPNCPKGRSWLQLNAKYSYEDICELNTYDISRHPLYNGSHNFQRYNLELPTDVHDGECFELGINYQRVYTILRRYGLDGGYTDAVLDLAGSGLTYNGGPTLPWNDLTVTATVDGGLLRLRFPPNKVHFGKIDVPVCISCATIGGGTIGFNMWHEILFSDNCSVQPFDQECKSGTFFLHCPSPCPEGGATPSSFDLERITLGLEDQNDDGTPDSNNTADPADVELNRAVNGDQVKGTWQIYVHPNTVGPNAGVPFNHVYVEFDTRKVNQGCSTAEPARTSFFDALPNAVATITPASGGATITCNVTPVVDNNGIAKYDLSSCKSGWEGGDEITLEAIFEVNAFVSKQGEDLYVSENEVYSSYVPNPAYNDQHTCNTYNDYLTIYNLWHSPYMPLTQGIDGCDNEAIAYIRQYISLQAPSGFFPNEYRNFGVPDQFIVTWPASQVYRPGSARFMNIPIPDANVTQSGDQLIFSNLRQFFTTYGGSLLPPDEIISNNHVKWSVDPTCDAEDFFQSRFTAITRGNGINTPVDWASHLGCNSKHSGYSNFTYDAPLPLITGGGETQPTTLETCWEVTLNNISNSQDAENLWFYFEDQNANLGAISLYKDGVEISPDANGFFRLGTNPASVSSDYIICADLTNCEDITLEVLMGYHCTTYPSSISNSNCVSSLALEGVPAQSEIQVLLESYPLNPANACEEQVIELAITSAQASFLNDAFVELTLPPGVSIIGNIELEYPSGSGNWVTVTATQSGTIYTVNLEDHPGIGVDGIPGTLVEPDDEEREVILKYVVDNTGTGEGIVMNTYGYRPCGDPAINNGIETKTADLDPLVADVVTEITICPGDEYLWEGEIYTDPGVYEVYKVNDNGCNFTCVLYLYHHDLPLISGGEDQTICAGTSATLIGSVTGGFGAETYQWQQSKNGGNSWEDIPGATNLTYDTPDLLATTSYRLVTTFADPGCGNIESGPSVITVEPASVVSNVVAGQDTLCPGESTVLTVNDGIQTGGLLDHSSWTVGPASIGEFNRIGLNSENNRIMDADPWGNNTIIWEAGNDADSNADGGWNTTYFPIDHTKDYRFSVWINRKLLGINGRAYLGTGGSGTVNGVKRLSDNSIQTNPYFWYSNVPPSVFGEDEWVLVVGHVHASAHSGTTLHPESGIYTLCDGKIGNTLSDYKWLPETENSRHRSYLYYCTDIDVRQQFVYPRVDVLDGTEPTLEEIMNGLDATGGLGAGASYEWFTGSCGGTLVGTGPTLPVTPSETTTYYVRATGNCNTTDCEEVTIVVSEPEVTIAEASPICEGDSILLTAVGTGGAGMLNYEWNDPSGATVDTVYVMPTTTTTYEVTVTDESGCTATDEVVVTVETLPTVTLDDETICSGSTVTLSPTITGGSGTISYQWQKSVNEGYTWTDISGATSSIFTTPELLGTSYYRVIVSWSGTACEDVTSNMATITVDPPSVVSNVVADQDTLCLGESTTLVVNDGIQTGGLIDHSSWTLGSGNVGSFFVNGQVSENNRVIDKDPWGNDVIVWEAGNDAESNGDGGWATGKFPIDNTKLYRFSVWVNRKVIGADGRAYLGVYGYGSTDGVNTLANSINTNPYFWYSSTPPTTLPEDEWVLLVGHVFPSDHTGTTIHPESGKYTLCEGKVGDTYSDYKWLTETVEARHRNYLFYSTDVDVRQQFVYPRVDVIDGAEPTIDEILQGFDATGGLGDGASYEWFTGSCGGTSVGTGPTLSVSPTETTTYFVRATGSCNTTDCEEVTITVSEPEVTIADPSSLCDGDSILLTATGIGLGTLSYAWDDPSSAITDTVTVMPTENTTYTVTVTDNYGCTASEEVVVTLNAPDDITVTNDGPITCAQPSVIMTVTPAGASYSWSSGGTGQDETVTTAGTYIVTLTNADGCVSVDSTIVLEDLTEPIAMVGDTAICIGESVVITATGGGEYLWSNSETTASVTLSPTTTTTYTVTVTSANGCSSSASTIVTVNPLPDNGTTVWRHILCSPSKGWVYADQAYPNVPTYLDNTTFETGSASCGDQYIHTEGVAGYSVVAENLPSIITGGSTYEFSVDYKYTGTGIIYARIVFYDAMWTYISTVTVALPPSGTWTTETITAVAPPGAANTHIGILAGEGISIDIDCFDLVEQGTGTIHTNSFEVVTPYSWTAPGGVPGAAGSAKGIYVTEPGIYTVTITDPETGCQNIGTVEALDQRTTPDLAAINDGPLTCADTIVVLTASSSVTDATYEWSSGGEESTDSVSTPGIYTVTVTDPSNGCTAETTTEVLENTTSTEVFCERYRIRDAENNWGAWIDFVGACEIVLCEENGQHDIQFDGGPNIDTGWVWTDEDGNVDSEVDELVVFPNIDVSDAGTYTGILTNEFGCTDTITFEVIVNPNPNAEVTEDLSICAAESVDLTATGGGSYAWSDDVGSTTPTITVTPTATTTYIVTVTDDNGCSSTAEVEVNVHASIDLSAGANMTFCDTTSVTLTPTVSGGVEPYNYAWTGPGGFTSSDMNPTVSETGVYTLVVTDANDCTATDMLNAHVFDCDQNTNCYFLDAFSTMSYFNSEGALSWSDYSWDEVGDNNSSSNGDVMIYDNKLLMEHTDSSLPSIQRRLDLSGHSSAVLSFDFSGVGSLDADDVFYVEVFDGTSWTTLFTFSGPFAATQMPWLDLSSYITADTEIRFGISSGFSDPGESLFLDNIRIDVDCLCEGIADAGIDVELCEGDTISLVGTGGVQYLWSPAEDLSDANIADPMAFPTTTTTYGLTVTDEFGCTDTDEVVVTLNESLDATVVAVSQDHCEDGSGEATITVTNGTGPFTINWETNSGTEQGSDTMDTPGSMTVTNLNGGTVYCFFVTDANGCVVTP